MKLHKPYLAVTWNRYTGSGTWKLFLKKPRALAYLERSKRDGKRLFVSILEIKGVLRNGTSHPDRGMRTALLNCLEWHQQQDREKKSNHHTEQPNGKTPANS